MGTNLRRESNPMAMASFIMGIISLACIVMFLWPVSMFFGLMAIIFAQLSKTDLSFFKEAKRGFIFGIISVAFNLLVVIVLVCLITFSAKFRNTFVTPVVEAFKEAFGVIMEEYSPNYYEEHDNYYDDGYDDYYDDGYDDYSDYIPEQYYYYFRDKHHTNGPNEDKT